VAQEETDRFRFLFRIDLQRSVRNIDGGGIDMVVIMFKPNTLDEYDILGVEFQSKGKFIEEHIGVIEIAGRLVFRGVMRLLVQQDRLAKMMRRGRRRWWRMGKIRGRRRGRRR
jgi:hypothetical protein